MTNLKEEQLAMLKNMGALGYPPSKIASIMSFSEKEVAESLKNKESDAAKAYQEGADYADYLIDLKLFEMCQSGDIRAMDKLEARKRMMAAQKK